METIGRYQVRDVLGRGGMGAVYRAYDPELDREVAIKVLKHGAKASEEHKARFLREAEVLARLRHPHVVTLHEVGEIEGAPYLVLDLVEGETLEARLKRGGPLGVPEALRIVGSLADALVQVHARGALHRDLKPENVLLDGESSPRLTDFGLALDLDGAAEARLSQTGHFMGTPGYASPEQAHGERAQIGPASDVFGLGAILYACLTGRAPFGGATLLMVLAATAQGTPDLPSTERPDVPRALDEICVRCLEKDPADRYPSVQALLEALSQIGPRAARRRSRGLALGGLGALLLGAGALVYAGVQSGRGSVADPQATQSLVKRPARTKTAVRELRWVPVLGAKERWTLSVASRIEVETPPDLSTVEDLVGAGRRRATCLVDVEVLSTSPEALALELRVRSFTVESQPKGKKVESLASEALPAKHPYLLLLASPIQVAFDPGSGRVTRVEGVDEVARAVAAATRGRGSLPQPFQNGGKLESALNRLLHVLPGDEGRGAWKIKEAVDLSKLEVASFQRSLEPFGAEIVRGKLGLTKRCTATRGLPATLRWHAQDSLRDFSGEATFAGGRITRSRATDRADVNVQLTLRKAQVRVQIEDRLELVVESRED